MPESGVQIPSSKYSRIEELIKIRAFDRLDLVCGHRAFFNNFPLNEEENLQLELAYCLHALETMSMIPEDLITVFIYIRF
jgi:hypothetical protein